MSKICAKRRIECPEGRIWDYNKMIVITFLKKYFIIKTSEGYL